MTSSSGIFIDRSSSGGWVAKRGYRDRILPAHPVPTGALERPVVRARGLFVSIARRRHSLFCLVQMARRAWPGADAIHPAGTA
ncbi:MAG: hypothetical protein KA169_13575, partial [Burkholderiaceae bacterium]|nr:hypothetical protein [Burkholderiaceae bacterium]